MTTRALCLLAAVVLGTPSLAAQVAPSLAPLDAPATPMLAAPALDSRLVVREVGTKNPARAADSKAWKDVVTRPWWQYPAIGAAVGVTAGVIQAKGTRDPIGFPVDPIYIFPTLYGAAGAFVGLLIDSAERERAARR